jgi:hypothetical protein
MSFESERLNHVDVPSTVAGMADRFSELYKDLLSGSYDCVDRIVLNAYFRPGHSAGGFRVWWQKLTGSVETLDNAHLMRLSGRFSRRVRAWAKASGIPLIDCRPGERKHDIAEEHLKKTTVKQGVFLLLVARAQAPVWDVSSRHRLERKKPMPYVNHYSFHILDPDWGHVTIKISGHPPFPAQVILNGHEYVACRARKAGIEFTKEGNCFTQISDAAGLAKIADTLSADEAIGRLSQVCERWIYSACLCFALDSEERDRSGFRYQYSNYQMEYSRNLIFEIGHKMDLVFQALIDRSRSRLDLNKVKTILGFQRRPRYRKRKNWVAEWDVTVERPAYDLTIFKLHCGKLTLKIYTKGERVLRIEAVLHNTEELKCGRSLDRFPRLVTELKSALERFMNALSSIDQCFISDDTLEQLPKPSVVGKAKVGGIDFNKERMRWAGQAVLALAASTGCFTASGLAEQVCSATGQTSSQYGPRHAAYDLKKLRAKNMVQRVSRSRRYEATVSGLRALAALVALRHHVIQPLLASTMNQMPSRGAHNPTQLDLCYNSLRTHMQDLLQQLGAAA